MDFMDEKIQEIRNQAKKLENKDIMGKVCIKDKEYEFEDVEFFDGKMSMRIPKDFTDMPLELAKLKYPMEQRPQVIKTNEDGSVNITLSLYDQALKKEEIKELRDTVKAALLRMNPAYMFFDNKLEETEELTVGYFDFKSNTLDSVLYSFMSFAEIEGKSLLGTFNCPFIDMDEWKIIFQQIILSIKDFTKQKKETQR